MRILIISTYDLNGGAGKAAFRLFESLNNINGVNIKMLVRDKSSNNSLIIKSDNFLSRHFGKFLQKLDNIFLMFYPNRQKSIFSTSWISSVSLKDVINEFKPDIINVHWINNGFLSLEHLFNIVNVPIVFSLHDMWLLTGGCHYNLDCHKYEMECFKCDQLNSKYRFDLSFINFSRKKKLFLNVNNDINIIGISKWITNLAINSPILKKAKIINLPNTINTNLYCRTNKTYVRKELGIPIDKKVLIFGAVNATTNKIKGFNYIVESLHYLDKSEFVLVVFGNTNDEFLKFLDIETIQFGVVNSEEKMCKLYNCADVFLLPSIQENLSNAVMESLSCALPVVAFDIGGNGDMIRHLTTGYLAKPFDAKDFANGINYIIGNNKMKIDARDYIIQNYSYPVVSERFVQYFSNIINNCN